MFEGLDENSLKGAVEALLFVTDEPVGTITMAKMLQCEESLVETALTQLRDELEANEHGIQLREVAGGWRLFTHPRYHRLIEAYVVSWDTRKLSDAALETLAIVAYLQPITRANISSVRGVNSDSALNSLMEKGLIREAGTADSPGNPTLYATSRVFLEKFGLRSVADLPDLSEFAPDEETRRIITERLSANRSSASISDAEAEVLIATDDQSPMDSDGPEVVTQDNDASSSVGTEKRTAEETVEALQAHLMAQALGAVEKIDFDSLNFDFDEE